MTENGRRFPPIRWKSDAATDGSRSSSGSPSTAADDSTPGRSRAPKITVRKPFVPALNAGRIEKFHPCWHHSHHREAAFPKPNCLVYDCRVGSKLIAPQPFAQENDITALGIFLFREKLATENGPNAQ